MATLTISGRADVAAAAAGVDDLSRSVQGLDDDVRRVDDAARTSGAGLDSLADSSDNAASRSSQAAGGLGDLAGGLDAIGQTGAATALGGVAIAAQTAVGAADILNLAASTTVGRFVAKSAATVAATATSVAHTVATGAMTAAQTALNAVMAANPIALVVLAVVALIAAVVIAYRQSETFREIVDGAFSRAREVVEAAGDAVVGFIDWLKELPGEARDAWGKVADAVEDKVDDAREFFSDLIEFVKDAPRDAASTVAGHFSSMFAPIERAIEWVDDLIDKIKDIDFPDFPDVNPFSRQAATSTTAIDGQAAPTIDLTINAAATPFDPEAWIEDLFDSLREYAARRGYTLTLTETTA